VCLPYLGPKINIQNRPISYSENNNGIVTYIENNSNNDSDIAVLSNLQSRPKISAVCQRVLRAMHPSELFWTANDFQDSNKTFQPHDLLTLLQLYDKLMTRLV